MFSYYGSKSKIVKKYPKPIYDIIIEPFAGSARYSLLYADNQVILNDSYKVIADIWKYLINATESQIKNLPQLNKGDDLRNLNLSEVERNLMGFMVCYSTQYPRHIYTSWAHRDDEVGKCKRRIISNLERIRHWRILNKDYRDLENIEATWFIDPPYQNAKYRYVKDSINYDELANWCKSRYGQVIVCEKGGASWLPFKFLTKTMGQRRINYELIWTND